LRASKRLARFLLRSACLANGPLLRATNRLAGRAVAPTPPLSAALGFSCTRFATAGNEALGRWGCRPHTPAFRSARFLLQTVRQRGQQSAWQMGAAAPMPPLSVALGLSCRWLATAGNDALGGYRPRTPAFRCARLVLQAARYRGQQSAWQAGASFPHTPAFRCARLVLQAARYCGQRNGWYVRAAAHAPPLSAALGFRFANGSLPRATKRLAGRGCRPHIPAFRCARLVLPTARHRGQRSAFDPAPALAHSYRDMTSHQIFRVSARMRW
jgi:hypothetical protein